MKVNKIHIICAFSFLLLACETTFDNQEELLSYVNNSENEFKQEKVVNDIEYSLVYKPTDILVAQERSNQQNEKMIDSLREKYSKYLYFGLSLSADNKELLNTKVSNQQDFGRLLQQLSFGMEEKIHLFSSARDTIPMIDYIYPRMFGMSNATSLLLVYPRDENILKEKEINITIEDLGFATGEVRFKFPTEKIKEEPRIQFNTN